MFFNNKQNNRRESSKGKNVPCNLFSLTGVRFFQPKFMDSLNNKSPIQNTSIPNSQTKPKINSFKNQSSLIPQINNKSAKQNIQPSSISKTPTKQNQTTLKKNNFQIIRCRIRGLNNIGNTCYMNSILQCLLNLNLFNSQLFTQLRDLSVHKKCLVSEEYINIVKQFAQSYNNSSFVPSKFKSSLSKKKTRFMGNSQQDAQQFLTSFLQVVNDQMSRIKQKPKYIELENNPTKKSIKVLSQEWWDYYKLRDDSVVCDNFQGQLISVVTCKKCKNQSITFDNIWGLPLSLGKTTSSISELIRHNWNFENEIEDYYCGVCKKHRNCTKKIQFFRLPKILVIQLKRFDYEKSKKEKIKTAVKLSESLELREFMNEYSPIQSHSYRLRGMVHHYGQIDYGHYTASVYKQQEKRWYLMNDSKACESIPEGANKTVYLSFYERM